jgi:hypothetical protein
MKWIAELRTRSPSLERRCLFESAEAAARVRCRVGRKRKLGRKPEGISMRAMMRPAVTGPQPKIVVRVDPHRPLQPRFAQ